MGTSNGRGVEQVVFADGTVWSQADLRGKVLTAASTSGNDTISGFLNADTIRGGGGNDMISGGDGTDTYLYARGDGHDTIIEAMSYDSTVDKLVLEGINPDAISLTRSGEAVTLVIAESAPGAGNGGSVTLKDGVGTSNGRGVEQVVFADGTVWSQADLRMKIANVPVDQTLRGTAGSDTLSGTLGNDVFETGTGNDTLQGGTGSDTYVYSRGDGSDYIDDASGSTTEVDTLRFKNLNASDISLARTGVHLYVTVIATGEVITLDDQFYSATANWGIDRFEFADGSSWNRTEIQAAVGRQPALAGTDGDDTLTGTSGADVINGLAGNDALKGLGGVDTIDGGAGTDTADYSDKTTAVVATLNGATNANVTVGGAAEDTIRNIENLTGGSAADTLAGDGLANVLTGNAGNDSLSGGSGNDTLLGGAGADRLDGGAGTDVVSYAGSSAGITVRLWDTGAGGHAQGDTYIDVEGAIGSSYDDLISGQDHIGEAIRGGAGNDQLYGFGGNDTLEGEAGDDFLQGGFGDDSLLGGDGDDALNAYDGNDVQTGGAGNDTFAFDPDFGKDVVTDFVAGAGSVDVIQFDSSILATYAAVAAAATQVGSDTLITVDAANTLTLKNVALASLHADDFRFV
ncbi:Ca2+-binding RTX toxin-like protein [Aureimonas pseudogalii]|uniref:Ca2+-binding RTX toxin-like protein n=1 Tax=Aureimonas pseudogalii TaxID=1744844 RepID=A0A7W6H813_9HYPH|nr:Ca2+-binding RTX toxin-like protein [Aureimonas pseudogalii]